MVYTPLLHVVGVAQLVRASGCGPECRGFESRHSPHLPPLPSSAAHTEDSPCLRVTGLVGRGVPPSRKKTFGKSKVARSAAVQRKGFNAFGVRRSAALWMMAAHVQFLQTHIRISAGCLSAGRAEHVRTTVAAYPATARPPSTPPTPRSCWRCMSHFGSYFELTPNRASVRHAPSKRGRSPGHSRRYART